MSHDEFKLLVVLALVFSIYSMVRIQSLAGHVRLFVLSCAIGFIAQLLLGPELNRYTPNITIYVSFVSLAAVIAWGIGLTSIYLAHLWVAHLLEAPPTMALYCCCGILILVLLEFTGSNIIRMKLHNFTQYEPLMPYLNAMHAPPWLYGYYSAVTLVFYYAARCMSGEEAKLLVHVKEPGKLTISVRYRLSDRPRSRR